MPVSPQQAPWYTYNPPAAAKAKASKAATTARIAAGRAQTLAAKPKTTAPMEDFYTRAVAQNRIVPTRTPMEDFYQRAVANQRVVRPTPSSWQDYYQRAVGLNRPLSELMPRTNYNQPPNTDIMEDYAIRWMLAQGYRAPRTPAIGVGGGGGGGGGYAYPEGYGGGGGGGYAAYLPNWMTGLFQLNANR